jgi:hypothetical protein
VAVAADAAAADDDNPRCRFGINLRRGRAKLARPPCFFGLLSLWDPYLRKRSPSWPVVFQDTEIAAANLLADHDCVAGFVRSWCLGCLAVCIWYEDLRGADLPAGTASLGEAP